MQNFAIEKCKQEGRTVQEKAGCSLWPKQPREVTHVIPKTPPVVEKLYFNCMFYFLNPEKPNLSFTVSLLIPNLCFSRQLPIDVAQSSADMSTTAR